MKSVKQFSLTTQEALGKLYLCWQNLTQSLKIKPNQEQFRAAAEVMRDIAQIFFAALVIDQLLKKPVTWYIVGLGLTASTIFGILILY